MIALSDNARGAVFMMVSMAAFVCNDTLVKIVSADLPLFTTVFLRGLVATALLAALATQQGVWRPQIARPDWRRIVFRMGWEVGATLCFLTALFNMPIANATAILQAMPLAVTLGAALFLGEKVGWRRYSAIVIGFFGVLVIIDPGSDGFNVFSLWAVGALVFAVLRDLTTRQLPTTIPSVFIALTTGSVITVVAGVASVTESWDGVGPRTISLLAASSVFLVIGYLTNVIAMRSGEIAVVSPFRYSILLWAVALGWLVFGDVPSLNMLIGSAIVIATGAFTLYRERAMRKRAAAMRPFGAA